MRNVTNLHDVAVEGTEMRGPAFVVNLTWEVAADLDLAAVCVPKDGGKPQLIYYGSVGRRCEAPFVHLAVDHQGGGRSKLRREHLVIANGDAHQKILLYVWNHDAIAEKKEGETVAEKGAWCLGIRDRYNSGAIIEQAFGAKENMMLVGELRGNRFTSLLKGANVDCYIALVDALKQLGGIELEVAA